MKRYAQSLSALTALWFLTAPVHAVLTTNSWVFTASSGKWEAPSNWSAGAPTNSDAVNLITNATTKTVTIDAITTNAANFTTLTISNLVLQGFGTVTNRLQLTSAGTNIPLRVLNSLTVGTNAVLVVTNSALEVQGVSGGDFTIDGIVTNLAGGQIIATNVSTVVGSTSRGNFTATGGSLLASNVVVGSFGGSQGTMTVAGGTNSLRSSLTVGRSVNATGAVWVTGGSLVVTNDLQGLLVGSSGVGQLTVSNGTVLSQSIIVGLNEQGTLTMVGGTNRVSFTIAIGDNPGSAGAVWMTGGQFVATNGPTRVGNGGVGQMTVSNGTVLCRDVHVGTNFTGQGTLTIAGGTNTLSSTLTVGDNSTGAVWVTGGQLVVTNGATRVGDIGEGQMTVSNGTVLCSNVIVSAGSLGQGTLTVAGGTNRLSSELRIGNSNTGTVWVTGGQLVVTNGDTFVGYLDIGLMTVSNGTWLAKNVDVGHVGSSQGTLTIAGGTNAIVGPLTVGINVTGTVKISGGQLVVTNNPALVGIGSGFIVDGSVTLGNGSAINVSNVPTVIGNRGSGSLTVFGGSMTVSNLTVGNLAGSQGTLTVVGGTNTVSTSLTVGATPCTATGTVVVAGGRLFVTNAAASAVLDVRSGTLTYSSGTLTINNLVITNSCGRFLSTGSALSIGFTNILANLDADGDGLPNSWETSFGLSPFSDTGNDGASGDFDGDGFTNLQEFSAGTNPTLASSHPTFNSWNVSPGGKWEDGPNWLLGTPPTTNVSSIFITNAATKTVTIDATTVTDNTISGCLTISNLTVSGSNNTLTNVGVSTPLRILDILTIAGGGNLVCGVGGSIKADNDLDVAGTVTITNGTLVATNATLDGTTSIGRAGGGDVILNGATSTLVLDAFAIGTSGAGTLTIRAGSVRLYGTATARVGQTAGQTATVWLAGGQLVITNNALRLGFTNGCLGQMTVSNGTALLQELRVGDQAGARGTLTMAGGTNTISSLFTVGNLANATGAVWVTGGQLTVTNNNTAIGFGGIGQMTVSNGTWLVRNVNVGGIAGSQGTLMVAGGTNALVGPLTVGALNATGTLKLTGGQLVVTNNPALVGAGEGFIIDGSVTLTNDSSINVSNVATVVGNTGSGSLTMNGGSMSLGDLTVGSAVGSQGTLTIAGGTNTLDGFLDIGSSTSSTGTVWVTSGQLVATNLSNTWIGESGVGQMTVSNGTWLANEVSVGAASGSRGSLTIAGGTNSVLSTLRIGDDSNATGAVWMTGGRLTVTDDETGIGFSGVGQMTVSNGTWLANDVSVGVLSGSRGSLTIAGGTNSLSSSLRLGEDSNATGAVWMTGGQLTVTNDFSRIGRSGIGQMTVSNGTWLARYVIVAGNSAAQGTLTIAGGTSSVFSNLTIGTFNCTATGIVVVAGGQLFVTNATTTALLDVRSGTLALSGGTLTVDKFVMTNTCGFFTHTGGTLIYGIAVLDPARDDDGDSLPNGWEQSFGLDPLDGTGVNGANGDPDGDGFTNLQEYQAGTDPMNGASVFRITAISRTNSDINVTWQTGTGKTNALERSTGSTGSYSNNFAATFTVTNTVGTTTNYLDVGAATNMSSFYYRVRLVP